MARKSTLPAGFARALRRTREEAGLTQEELADAAGVAPRYVGQIERGHQSPGLAVIEALAVALGKRPDQLVRAAQDAVELT